MTKIDGVLERETDRQTEKRKKVLGKNPKKIWRKGEKKTKKTKCKNNNNNKRIKVKRIDDENNNNNPKK